MGNKLLDYSEYFKSTKALWHVHTSYTDGKCSVKEVFDLAGHRGIEFICFIEHIRSRPTYSPEDLMNEIIKYSSEKGIQAILGFEAKLLPHGSISIPEQKLNAFIFLAEHGNVSNSKEEYFSTLLKGLSNKAISGWVHPGLLAMRMGWKFSNQELDQIVSVMKQNELVYEMNKRYGLPLPPLTDALMRANIPFFHSVDFHEEEDLEG